MTRHTDSLHRAVRAVVFDIDGTLYPVRRIALRSAPLIASHLRLFAAFGKARRTLRLERPGPALRRRQAELAARSLGVEADEAARRIEQVVYGRWPRCFGRLRPYAGVTDTLAMLRRKGMLLGVVSDSPFTREKLRALGMQAGWDAIVSADEAGALKPNQEPFLRVARLLDVAPGEVLFVGNSYRRDVVGAHRAGMLAAHFTRRPVRAGVAAVSFPRYRSFPRLANAPRSGAGAAGPALAEQEKRVKPYDV